jgi:16S rRNA (guanine527-N7)-methyltransferase
LIDRALDELALSASPLQRGQLLAHLVLLEKWARTVNLSGHRTQATAITLTLEALALGACSPRFESLVDIGSGAGFPGIPLAIVLPRRAVSLVESRERRHHFQCAVIRELELGNVRAILGRAESLDPDPHDAAVVQAVADPDTAAPMMARWVRSGGQLLFPTSRHLGEPQGQAGIRFLDRIEYQVPCGGPERVLWIAERQ